MNSLDLRFISTCGSCYTEPGDWPASGATFLIFGKSRAGWTANSTKNLFDVDALTGSNGTRLQSSFNTAYYAVPLSTYPLAQIVDDINGDGKKDFVYTGSAQFPSTWNLKMVFNQSAWPSGYTTIDPVSAGGNFNGTNGTSFNYSSDNADLDSLATGDVTGDGIHDVLVGEVEGAGGQGGIVYLIYGHSSPYPAAAFDNSNGNAGVYWTKFTGDTTGCASPFAGAAVQVLDLDQDGTGDIVIAAPNACPTGTSGYGSVYVLWGASTWNGTTTYSLSNIQ